MSDGNEALLQRILDTLERIERRLAEQQPQIVYTYVPSQPVTIPCAPSTAPPAYPQPLKVTCGS